METILNLPIGTVVNFTNGSDHIYTERVVKVDYAGTTGVIYSTLADDDESGHELFKSGTNCGANIDYRQIESFSLN